MWITFDFNLNQKNDPHTLKIEGSLIHRNLDLYTACGQPKNSNKENALTQKNLVHNLV
jgi:hypothetical protein